MYVQNMHSEHESLVVSMYESFLLFDLDLSLICRVASLIDLPCFVSTVYACIKIFCVPSGCGNIVQCSFWKAGCFTGCRLSVWHGVRTELHSLSVCTQHPCLASRILPCSSAALLPQTKAPQSWMCSGFCSDFCFCFCATTPSFLRVLFVSFILLSIKIGPYSLSFVRCIYTV